MTSEQFRTALASIGWSQRALADRLGLDSRQIRRWASGEYAPPPNVAAWLAQLAEAHDAAPLPDGWRTRRHPILDMVDTRRADGLCVLCGEAHHSCCNCRAAQDRAASKWPGTFGG